MTDAINIKVVLSGGLELLFAGTREFKTFSIPKTFSEPPQPSNINFLIKQLQDREMRDKRKELFIKDDTVRPGILVLVNEADWELEGMGEYLLEDGDEIAFISTLHGG